MASSRVKATTTIALSVIEDVLTLATTIVASSIAFSMRSIGFVLLKSPHVVPVFKRGARERENTRRSATRRSGCWKRKKKKRKRTTVRV